MTVPRRYEFAVRPPVFTAAESSLVAPGLVGRAHLSRVN